MDSMDCADGEETVIGAVPEETVRKHRYATTEEVMRAFRETLPQHERTYRELAKGPGAPADSE